MKGYKGTFLNLILTALIFMVDSKVRQESPSMVNLHLPIHYLIVYSILILFERRANLNILSIEFKQISHQQNKVWERFRKSWYFGIQILMSIVWRTYFRTVLILFPLLGYIYKNFDITYQTAIWPLKLPYWVVCGWIGVREFRMVAAIIEPPNHHVSLPIEWISRVIQVVLNTLFLSHLTIMMNDYIDVSKDLFTALLQITPFLLIVFTFFYIPIRFVEVVSDFIDLRSKWQTIIFWISTFFLMLTVVAPKITGQIIRFDY